jgi:hypothetical protein
MFHDLEQYGDFSRAGHDKKRIRVEVGDYNFDDMNTEQRLEQELGVCVLSGPVIDTPCVIRRLFGAQICTSVSTICSN